jgi:hypothetical protein
MGKISMTNQPHTAEKPKEIVLAIKLLWAYFAVSILGMVLNWGHVILMARTKSPDFPPPNFPMTLEMFLILTMSLSLTILLWIILKISSSRNWARILYLITMIIGVPSWLLNFMEMMEGPKMVIVLSIFAIFLSLGACVLLFTRPSNAWFKEQKALRKLKK